MGYSPRDILEYVIDKELEADFLVSNTMHKMGYSIGEITDAKFINHDNVYYLKSKSYKLNLPINDEDICNSIEKKSLVSAFISRYKDTYQVEFLVHRFTREQQVENAEEIAHTVVQFMILKTIVALRLDTPEKIDSYIKN